MRWLFLLLLVLNVFYYVWHQQEAPLRAKDVTPLSLYRGSQQDIRLLSEATDTTKGKSTDGSCLYLGGFARQESAQALQRRLGGLDIKFQILPKDLPESGGYWVRVAPDSRRLLDDLALQNLSKEFNELKHKIMPCEGVAPAE
ncbi:SPOR domain-containing protein [Pseudomonas sp. A-RE-19]|uniref:SPOR domain-containing protein n=1 Tax=Pseudomonas sp. A-RE-19 TaxID=2832401 RepID=UPI001CBABDE8|nr:SPOR domain-containing protein [Pseudomonas sp. A-RE-19]